MTTFSAAAWQAAQPVYGAILTHPFITGLATGTLPGAIFSHYLGQDGAYLKRFAAALRMLAQRMEAPEDQALLTHFVTETMAAEHSLHAHLAATFPASINAPETSATATYGDFLETHAASGPCAVALAALLPCFRLYDEIGRAIAAASPPKNPYQAWISTYTDPTFTAAVHHMEALTDRHTAPDHSAAHAAYLRSCELELAFFDSAWAQKS